MTTKQKPIEKMTFEEAYQEIETIMENVQAGAIPLEKLVNYFKRGKELELHCSNLLAKAEVVIENTKEKA